MRFGQLIVGLGLLVLIHAGFSAVHYEGLITERYGDVGHIQFPFDIYVELAVALVLGMIGSLLTVGRFVAIYSTGQASINYFHKMFAPRFDFAPLTRQQQQQAVAAGSSRSAAH